MEITENFALLVNPIRVNGTNTSVNVHKSRWLIHYRNSAGGWENDVALTEASMWHTLLMRDPTIKQNLAEGPPMHQALARRMDLFLHEEPLIEAKEAALMLEMTRVHKIVMDHLGLPSSMTRKRLTRTHPSHTVSWYYTRAKVSIPFENELRLVTGRYLPSPTVPNGWMCSPTIGCTNLQSFEHLREKQESLADRFTREGLVLQAVPFGLNAYL